MKIAAVVHLYYDHLWPELAGYLRNIRQKHTLFVTIPEVSTAAAMVLRDFPQAQVIAVPNVGRDIAPFIALLRELQSFDLVCKIHTKRDVNGDPSWRRIGLQGVLGTPSLVRRIVWSFRLRRPLMLVGARTLYLDGPQSILRNEPVLRRYCETIPRAYGFFAGTMFWARPRLMADFPDLIGTEDFVPHLDEDGQLEHAVERLIGIRAAEIPGATVGLVRQRKWYKLRHIKIHRADAPGKS